MSSLYVNKDVSIMFLRVKFSDSTSKLWPVVCESRSQCLAIMACKKAHAMCVGFICDSLHVSQKDAGTSVHKVMCHGEHA